MTYWSFWRTVWQCQSYFICSERLTAAPIHFWLTDKILRTGLCTILNVDLHEDQWLQASLPVADGGPGIRSDQMLASSAFLASAASTLTLQESILPSNIKSVPDQSVASTEIVWKALSSSPMQPATSNTSRRPGTNWWQQNTHRCSSQEPSATWTKPYFWQHHLATQTTGCMHLQ